MIRHLIMQAPAKCDKCGKTAYATEQVRAGPRCYHVKCFSCHSCAAPLAKGSQSQGKDDYPYCKKCYASHFGPGGFRGGAVDGSISVSNHKFDTQSHVKPHGYNNTPAPTPGVKKQFCAACGAKLTAGAKVISFSLKNSYCLKKTHVLIFLVLCFLWRQRMNKDFGDVIIRISLFSLIHSHN